MIAARRAAKIPLSPESPPRFSIREMPRPGVEANNHDEYPVANESQVEPCHGGDEMVCHARHDQSIQDAASENQNLQDPASMVASTGQEIDEAVARSQLTKEDCWQRVGKCLARIHGQERAELFIPFRVPGSPPGRELFSVRLTKGKFRDGRSFEKLDSFRNRYDAHTQLSGAWTGITLFFQGKLMTCALRTSPAFLLSAVWPWGGLGVWAHVMVGRVQ